MRSLASLSLCATVAIRDSINNPVCGLASAIIGSACSTAKFVSGALLATFTANSIASEDPRYLRMGDGAFVDRTAHAFEHTFVGRSDDGKRIPPWVRFASTYGAAFLANWWSPDRLSNSSRALVRGTMTLASDTGNNLISEFWPDLKKKLFHRNQPRAAAVVVKTP